MEYSCKLCDKKYSTYKSLWNHNKIKHTENVVQSHTSVVQQDTNRKED
jgi:hypothetical protein